MPIWQLVKAILGILLGLEGLEIDLPATVEDDLHCKCFEAGERAIQEPGAS